MLEVIRAQYLNFKVFPLFKLSGLRCFAQSNGLVYTSSFFNSVYFLRGNDSRQLSLSQSREMAQLVEKNNFQTSCLVYNSNEAMRKLSNWKKTLPWITPHYAIKSNPALPMLKDMHSEGCGFDCASRTQLENVLDIGANKENVVYSNPIKDQSDLQWAERNGIKLTSADSIDELEKIQRLAPNMGILWRIAIKEDSGDKLATPFSNKFGDDLQSTEDIHHRMQEIANKGIVLRGIHFHCGSGMHGSSTFGKAVILARNCMKIGRAYGHKMDILDIGGGFPSGDLSQKTVDALKITENDSLGYKVIAEPGRHFCANSFYLLTRILGRRTKNGKLCYHLNDSLYHSFNCNVMDGVSFQNRNQQFYRCLESSNQVALQERQQSTFFGMTCDGMDVIAKNIAVPENLKVGDWLCLSGMGAYTYGCRSNFNGMRSTERVIRWNSSVHQPTTENIPALDLAFI